MSKSLTALWRTAVSVPPFVLVGMGMGFGMFIQLIHIGFVGGMSLASDLVSRITSKEWQE